METLIGIGAFIIVALAGWGIAELKGKSVNYTTNEEEDKVLAQQQKALEENGFSEMNIGDVVRTISTKGYEAA